MRKDVDLSKIIIFDDFERSDMNEKSILGAVNHYVEHFKCRVVVIAHDEKFEAGIKEAKEKVFGQTIRVEPNFASAFQAFLSEIKADSSRQFVEDNRENIKAIFNASEVKSLRILRQAIFNITRLFDVLDENYKQNEPAMREMVGLMLALDLEVREGRIDKEALSNFRRMSSPIAVKGEYEKTKLGVAQERYKFIRLDNYLLNDEVLIQMLLMGRFEPSAIHASLDGSSYFAKTEMLPPWRKVIDFDSLGDNTVDEAVALMLRQFDERTVTESGEMLHIFALLFMLSWRGVYVKEANEIEASCKKYVDDLLAEGRLPPPENPTDFERSWWFQSAHHHTFWPGEGSKEAFKRVAEHLHKQLLVSLENTYKTATIGILELLGRDADKFSKTITYAGDGDHKFASLPVLKVIDPKLFVDTWLGSPKEHHSWIRIKRALERRYNGGTLLKPQNLGGISLESETKWLKLVISELKSRAENSVGLTKFRIERAIPEINFPEYDQ
jgi:hypothetical protein